MEVKTAFKELVENGFDILQLEVDKFEVTDNGKFGFLEETDPFIVDGEELLEIYETYLGDN
jgi:hypothetical protein